MAHRISQSYAISPSTYSSKGTTSKRSIKGKRLQAAWNPNYLEKVLAGLASLT